RECYRDGLRDFSQIHMELLRDGRNRKDEDEEVKGIESPAQETRDQGVEVVFALFVAGGRHALESNGIDSPPTLIHPGHARRTLNFHRLRDLTRPAVSKFASGGCAAAAARGGAAAPPPPNQDTTTRRVRVDAGRQLWLN